MTTITIEIDAEEDFELQAIAIKHGVTREELLASFVADVTGSTRTRGSDERELSREYLQRAYPEREGVDLTEAEANEVDDLYSAAYEARIAASKPA